MPGAKQLQNQPGEFGGAKTQSAAVILGDARPIALGNHSVDAIVASTTCDLDTLAPRPMSLPVWHQDCSDWAGLTRIESKNGTGMKEITIVPVDFYQLVERPSQARCRKLSDWHSF